MPRLPLLPADAEDEAVAEAFRTFREEGREPIALYRTLAHAPRMLRAFSATGRGLRHDAGTPRGLRELVIMRTAELTGSVYEYSHHWPMALSAGNTEEKLGALSSWERSDLFSPSERAALRCADEVHRVGVTDETFAELQGHFDSESVIEIVLTAAFYQAVARTLQALAVEVEPAYERYVPAWER
jgi:alkylhydroperoxidase family enzyme